MKNFRVILRKKKKPEKSVEQRMKNIVWYNISGNRNWKRNKLNSRQIMDQAC